MLRCSRGQIQTFFKVSGHQSPKREMRNPNQAHTSRNNQTSPCSNGSRRLQQRRTTSAKKLPKLCGSRKMHHISLYWPLLICAVTFQKDNVILFLVTPPIRKGLLGLSKANSLLNCFNFSEILIFTWVPDTSLC